MPVGANRTSIDFDSADAFAACGTVRARELKAPLDPASLDCSSAQHAQKRRSVPQSTSIHALTGRRFLVTNSVSPCT
jgi:hypothetical protein